MPYRKYVRKVRKHRRKLNKRLRKRANRPRHQIFSETFQASNLFVCSDGSTTTLPANELTANIASISQYSSYKALYDKYRILRLDWTIIPKFATAEANQAEANIGLGGPYDSNIRLHYRRSWDTASLTLPGNELAMLQLNGVRTLMMSNRPLRFSMKYPTSQFSYVSAVGTGNVINGAKNVWCSFGDSVPVTHGNMTLFPATDSTGLLGQAGTVCASVFCRVTFAVANPK